MGRPSAVAKSSVSMPATYLDIFGGDSDSLCSTSRSQVRGLTYQSFSLARAGGDAKHAKAKAKSMCPCDFFPMHACAAMECQGQRYRPHVLDVKYKDRSIAEVFRFDDCRGLSNTSVRTAKLRHVLNQRWSSDLGTCAWVSPQRLCLGARRSA